MRLNYKRLGEYIQPINERNLNLEVETLLGVSIRKVLMPSIANTIGTDMSRYKIIKKNQFAYGPVTSRNGDKISIALLEKHEKALVSQAYTVFEIIDDEVLNTEYLMMWFRRPEFDRYARFKSHGSARETFDWEEMQDTEIPIPSIEKQREIVKEYNTIVNRISLNETLNQKLEDTAQALYKHWFVDFNFPITEESCPELVSGSPQLEGKPYKSSGGEMIYNAELDLKIPEEWKSVPIDEFIDDSLGGDWGKDKPTGNYTEKVKCVRGTDIPLFKKGNLENAPIRYILEKNLQNREIAENQIIIEISGGSPTQSTGRSVLVTNHHLNVLDERIICSNFCRILKLKDDELSKFVFSHIDYLYKIDYLFSFENSTTGVKNFNLNSFLEEEYLVKPNYKILQLFNINYNTIIRNTIINQKEIDGLKRMKELLLSKMSKVETNTVLV